MNRHTPESGSHRLVSSPEEGRDEILFEGLVMKQMGVAGDDNAAALAWVSRYAERFRALIDETNGVLRAQMRSDPEATAKLVAAILRDQERRDTRAA